MPNLENQRATQVKHALYINELHRKKVFFSQAEEREEVFVFCKNVLEMFWFLRKTTLK